MGGEMVAGSGPSGRDDRRRAATFVAVGGLALLLAIAYWWAGRQGDAGQPTPPIASEVAAPSAPPAPEPSRLRVERDDTTIRLSGTVRTRSEREALAAAVTGTGFEVDDRLRISDRVTDSDPRVVAALLGPLLDGTDDGELSLDDGHVTITGEALDPVEAEEIAAAIDTAVTAGLTVENRTTTRVLPEALQIVALQEEIDQIFELARAIEGQSPNFAVSVDQLGDGARTTLDRVAVAMRRYPLPAADIIGHTDSVGSEAANLALSESRAQAVMDYLVGVGVDPGRLQVMGRGESEPVADNETEAGRAENRRVDFVVRRRDG